MTRRLPMVGIVCIRVEAAGLAWLMGTHGDPWRGERWATGAWGPVGVTGPGPGVASGTHTFASNGEQIYYTGVSRKTGPSGRPRPRPRMGRRVPRGCVSLAVGVGSTTLYAAELNDGIGALPKFAIPMREVGGFQNIYFAAKGGNWGLAFYMAKYMNTP